MTSQCDVSSPRPCPLAPPSTSSIFSTTWPKGTARSYRGVRSRFMDRFPMLLARSRTSRRALESDFLNALLRPASRLEQPVQALRQQQLRDCVVDRTIGTLARVAAHRRGSFGRIRRGRFIDRQSSAYPQFIATFKHASFKDEIQTFHNF